MLMLFLYCSEVHYVTSYCDYNYSTCDSCVTTIARMAPNSVGLIDALGQYDVVLSSPLIPRDSERCCWP